MAIEENREIALTFLKSLETGPRMDLLADDLRWWVQGRGDMDKAQFVDVVAAAIKVKAPSRMDIRHVTAEENRVAIECDGKGRFHDGRAYENTYHFLFILRDGLIVEVHEHHDTAYARDAMGALPS